VDGISVYAPDFWFNLRPSNTEDKIKFTVEANNGEIMNKVVDELRKLL
jgi:phosphomannomutase